MRRFEDVIIDPAGNAVIGAAILVIDLATQTAAALFQDAAGTVSQVNPVLTDGVGRFGFYIDDGRYDLQVSGPGIQNFVLKDVQIFDLQTFGQPGKNDIKTLTASVSGTLNPGEFVAITLNPFAFFPMIFGEAQEIAVVGHDVDGADPDATRFGLKHLNETPVPRTFAIDYRFIST